MTTKDKTPRKRVNPMTEAAFKALVKRVKTPILVQFYSPDCGHCAENKPELEEAAAILGDEATIVRVNGDTSPKLADSLNVEGYPESYIYHNGQVVANLTAKKAKGYVAALRKVSKGKVPS